MGMDAELAPSEVHNVIPVLFMHVYFCRGTLTEAILELVQWATRNAELYEGRLG